MKGENLSSLLCDDLNRWDGVGGREAQEEGDVCMHMIDPPHCTAESNTALQSNYTIIKKKKFLKRKLNIKNLVKR